MAEKELEKLKKHIEDNPQIIEELANTVKEIWDLDNPDFAETRAFLTDMTLKQMKEIGFELPENYKEE